MERLTDRQQVAGSMNVLFVTPVTEGTGEVITALHMAHGLVAAGHTVTFLASPMATQLISPRLNVPVFEFGDDGPANHQLWATVVRQIGPDVVVFADYPLMFTNGGTSPLALEPGWADSLANLKTCLVSLDHLGFAQGQRLLFLGPPHLVHGHITCPSLPEGMRVLLPCPINHPGPVPGREGEPFRYWSVPIEIPAAACAEARRRYVEDNHGFFIFHSVPSWAWRLAEALKVPYYDFLAEILEHYLEGVSSPVTVVSVNNGHLLRPVRPGNVHFVNLPPLPVAEYEALIFSADLVLTENKVSSSTGKAVCAGRPCAVLKNSYRLVELTDQLGGALLRIILAMESRSLGSIYPYEVFPNLRRKDIAALGVYRDNTITQAFEELEVYGGDATADTLRDLLTNPERVVELLERGRDYVEGVRDLPDGTAVLTRVLEEHHAGRR
jgi:hypothetical protein